MKKFYQELFGIVVFLATVGFLAYGVWYVSIFRLEKTESSCETVRPLKVMGGNIYSSWGPDQYFLSYAGKDKISGDECVVEKVRVTLSEYERKMY